MKKKIVLKDHWFIFMVLIVIIALLGPAICRVLRQAEGGGWQVHAGEPVVRLHVRAAGDSPAEQRFKMAVAAQVRRLLSAESPPEAGNFQMYLEFLKGHLPKLERSLREFAAATAEETQIGVRLTQEEFPLRTYGRRIYPAGNYTALTVTIGEGDGENWWCLLFPSLCLPPVMFNHHSAEEEQKLNNDEEESLLSAGMKEPTDFGARSKTEKTKQPAISGRWRSKVWEFIKRPGKQIIEKAEQIFYN